jgi:protein-L-isoaspartate(D-aspartate) O-methyltransferase
MRQGESHFFCLPHTTPAEDLEFSAQRKQMVQAQLRQRNITDKKILAAFKRVPRHYFVPKQFMEKAYADYPLPIAEGQTISQPFMVGLMTTLVCPGPTDSILDVGTGSGYQTAILAELCEKVYTIERHSSLSTQAQKRLRALNYGNIHFRVGDGSQGWVANAPFNGILVAASGPHVPKALLTQLHPEGGRLVVPVGSVQNQELWLIIRQGDRYTYHSQGHVRFVPLIGEEGWH